MGKCFVSVIMNGLELNKIYNQLIDAEIIEADELKHFNKPLISEIKDIEVGVDGTKKSILRLNDGGYTVIDKTIRNLF